MTKALLTISKLNKEDLLVLCRWRVLLNFVTLCTRKSFFDVLEHFLFSINYCYIVTTKSNILELLLKRLQIMFTSVMFGVNVSHYIICLGMKGWIAS